MATPTFSITANEETWPGVVRALAQAINVKTTSAFRHSLSSLEAVVIEVMRGLPADDKPTFDSVVNFYSAQSEVLVAGMSLDRKESFELSCRRSGHISYADFVQRLSLIQFVALVECARWTRAFGDIPYGWDITKRSAKQVHRQLEGV